MKPQKYTLPTNYQGFHTQEYLGPNKKTIFFQSCVSKFFFLQVKILLDQLRMCGNFLKLRPDMAVFLLLDPTRQ